MSLQAIFLVFILSTFNFGFINCLSASLEKSKLPKEMPENTRFRYNENGGMAPTWYRIEVKGNIISVEDKDMQEDKADLWHAEITDADKAAVYKIFSENEFDLIKNEKPKGTVYDAGSAGVYIRAGKVSKNISYSPNSPLSAKNKKRWNAAANAIKDLAKKYKNKAKKVPDNYTLISYNSQNHSPIFKDVGFHDLEQPETIKVSKIVEKAFSEHNKSAPEQAKISNIGRYKFQLVSAKNSKNETVVWVNALCSAADDWRRRLIIVSDGGSCFFNLYINLTKETHEGISVNGEA